MIYVVNDAMFVTIPTVWENGHTALVITLSRYWQLLWDYTIKFARWQHPAMGEVCCARHHLLYFRKA